MVCDEMNNAMSWGIICTSKSGRTPQTEME